MLRLTRPFVSITAMLALALACILLVIIVTTQANGSKGRPDNNLAPAAAVPATVIPGGPNLTYPGSRELTVKEQDLWPNGRSAWDQAATFKAFASTDEYQVVTTFFINQLKTTGYTITVDGTGCSDPQNCHQRIVAGNNGITELVFSIFGSTAFTGNSSDPYSFLQKDLRSDETLITMGIAPVRTRILPTEVPPTPTVKS